MDLNKKVLTIGTLVFSMLLVGCGQQEDTKKEVKKPSESVAKLNKISYLGNTYTVKVPTSKIVTASFEAMEDAAALSVKPIGAVTVS